MKLADFCSISGDFSAIYGFSGFYGSGSSFVYGPFVSAISLIGNLSSTAGGVDAFSRACDFTFNFFPSLIRNSFLPSISFALLDSFCLASLTSLIYDSILFSLILKSLLLAIFSLSFAKFLYYFSGCESSFDLFSRDLSLSRSLTNACRNCFLLSKYWFNCCDFSEPLLFMHPITPYFSRVALILFYLDFLSVMTKSLFFGNVKFLFV